MPPFRIKICGVRTVEDALLAAESGADAVGLNFYPASKRYVDPELARQIVATLPTTVTPVAVVVNRSTDDILHLCRLVGIHWVQLHGDETADMVATMDPALQVIRARRLANWEQLAADLHACERAGRVPDAVLVDALVEGEPQGEYGGTGRVANWHGFADRQGTFSDVPLLLAGGLNPANVAEAIHVVRPWGVDTASGVESSPGVKHPQFVSQFVESARQSLGQFGQGLTD